MTYGAEISRENPSCILFLIDQSASMSDPFSGKSGRSKADRLASAINRLLYELVIRCTRDQEEGIRNYYEVGVIGYGDQVRPALSGELGERDLIPIRQIGDNPDRVEERQRKVEDGAGGLVEETVRFPIWFDPVSRNGTPMCQALRRAHSTLTPWVEGHRTSFPPIVINITDGEATDGEPRGPASALKKLATDDGELLLFNLHLSSRPGAPIMYPRDKTALPDKYAIQLFEMSSVLPPHVRGAAEGEGYDIQPQSHGFVFNADMVEVITFLDIGTRPKGLR